jgi:hypothetical protein
MRSPTRGIGDGLFMGHWGHTYALDLYTPQCPRHIDPTHALRHPGRLRPRRRLARTPSHERIAKRRGGMVPCRSAPSRNAMAADTGQVLAARQPELDRRSTAGTFLPERPPSSSATRDTVRRIENKREKSPMRRCDPSSKDNKLTPVWVVNVGGFDYIINPETGKYYEF